MIYEKETTIIEEVTKDKIDKIKFLKDDKSLVDHVIDLMTRNKKSEIRIPELFDNNELKEEYFNCGKLSEDEKYPARVLSELSNIISFKILQASINQNTEANKICVVIDVDRRRTIDKMRKFYHSILILVSKYENRGVFLDLIDMIFSPNKPSICAPSLKGTRLYLG